MNDQSQEILMFLRLSVVSLVAFVGCAGQDEPSRDDANLTGGGVASATIAGVTANGTGCPTSKPEAHLSDDRKTVSIGFEGYEAALEPGSAFAIKDCAFGIDLRAPEGFTYAVSATYNDGQVELDTEGMRAKQAVKYHFMGNPAPAKELANETTGPRYEALGLNQPIPPEDQVFAPCGASRRLNALTRLTVHNDPLRSGRGRLTFAKELRFELTWKPCSP
jgi:hypothetical protein